MCAGLLPELGALGDVLARRPEWADDLRAIRARQLRILQLVAARYQAAGESASAVVLLEAAVRELEETLGLRHPGILALSKRAEAMFEALPPDVRQQVRCNIPKGVAHSVLGCSTRLFSCSKTNNWLRYCGKYQTIEAVHINAVMDENFPILWVAVIIDLRSSNPHLVAGDRLVPRGNVNSLNHYVEQSVSLI